MKLYERINDGNWFKGKFVSNDGTRRCLLGHAIEERLFTLCGAGNILENPTYQALSAAINLLYPDRSSDWSGVAHFNDHPDTTVEDVIRVCKVADV